MSNSWRQIELVLILLYALSSTLSSFILLPTCPMVSDIQAPENMPRCINNCYNLESFWKNWHASFNKWLVRCMYIPLGGSRRKLLNVWVVFTLVAIWHDLQWKLLSWAWLTCIFFIPEMLVKSVATSVKVIKCIFFYDFDTTSIPRILQSLSYLYQ